MGGDVGWEHPENYVVGRSLARVMIAATEGQSRAADQEDTDTFLVRRDAIDDNAL